MPTAWASSPEEMRPSFSLLNILRRFSSPQRPQYFRHAHKYSLPIISNFI